MPKDLSEQADIKFIINDNCDACIRIRQKSKKKDDNHHHHDDNQNRDYRATASIHKQITLDKVEKVEEANHEDSEEHEHEHDDQKTIYIYERGIIDKNDGIIFEPNLQ